MNPLLVALLLVLVLPLFVASWRASLLGLAAQGLLMAWIAMKAHPDFAHASTWLLSVDLVVLRAVVGPALLWRVLRAREAPPRHDVIPPNLLSWTVALAIVLMAFRFASLLVPAAGGAQAQVAVVATGVMLGFLVLATQPGPFGQMIGALRIENAIALFELDSPHGDDSLVIRAGQLLVVLFTLVLFRWYLAHLGPSVPPPEPTAEGAPL